MKYAFVIFFNLNLFLLHICFVLLLDKTSITQLNFQNLQVTSFSRIKAKTSV